jgi:hypothetical protein
MVKVNIAWAVIKDWFWKACGVSEVTMRNRFKEIVSLLSQYSLSSSGN